MLWYVKKVSQISPLLYVSWLSTKHGNNKLFSRLTQKRWTNAMVQDCALLSLLIKSYSYEGTAAVANKKSLC